jgi:hypothetical protein
MISSSGIRYGISFSGEPREQLEMAAVAPPNPTIFKKSLRLISIESRSPMADDAVDTDLPLAVARDAIIHIQSPNLFYLLHGFNRTVAGLTGESGANVRPVLKKNEIGHRSGLSPLNGLLSVPVAFQFLYFRLICSCDFVATHAALNRGNASYGSSASINMTVLTRDFVIARMDLMAERNRLNGPRRLTKKTQSHSDGYDKEGQQACPYQPLFHAGLFFTEGAYVGDKVVNLIIC